MKKFAAFDIDGTLIRWQLYHALADELARRGYICARTYRRMKDARMAWKKRTEASFRDYEIEVIKVYELAIKKLTFAELDKAIDAVFKEYKDQVYVYTRELIKKLEQQDYMLLAISGSQTEIIKKIAGYYGFDDFEATVYERSEKGFTGKKIVASHQKDKVLMELVRKHSLSYEGSIAVGDSASDIAMLEMVELPIAFNPEQHLFEHARRKGWKVVIERKNMYYELEKKDGKYQLAKTNS
ncbi:MAG TPA: HAD family phosphatase [Candidatus Saccharimonadales bacterium]|nr:HAD family phosphatase [Candidatus Saccharimonadales bacterium]